MFSSALRPELLYRPQSVYKLASTCKPSVGKTSDKPTSKLSKPLTIHNRANGSFAISIFFALRIDMHWRIGWVVRFAQICRVFWRSEGGGSRLRMSLKVHRISSMNTSRKCVCPLQIVYAYLASGGFALRPPPGLCPWTPLGDFCLPDPVWPPYLQTLATSMLTCLF